MPASSTGSSSSSSPPPRAGRPLSPLRPHPGAGPGVPLGHGELDRHPLRRLPAGAAGPRTSARGADQDATARMRHRPLGDPAPRKPPTSSSSSRRRQSMLTLNPPDHTRLRGLVARAFTPDTVEALRPHVVALCDGLLDTMADARRRRAQTVDVMRELAFPLPVAVIGELLGVPGGGPGPVPSPRPGRHRASSNRRRPSTTCAARARRGSRWSSTSRTLIAERRRRPADDLLSELIAVSDGSDRLTRGRGHRHRHPAVRSGVRDHHEPHRQRAAGPCCATPTQLELVRGLGRRPRGGATGGGGAAALGQPGAARRPGRRFGTPRSRASTVAAGEQVMTLLGAANRDPRRFTSIPTSLDLRRDEGPPMSFGSGIHYCLGAAVGPARGPGVLRPPAHALQRRRAGARRRHRAPRLHHAPGPRPASRGADTA